MFSLLQRANPLRKVTAGADNVFCFVPSRQPVNRFSAREEKDRPALRPYSGLLY